MLSKLFSFVLAVGGLGIIGYLFMFGSPQAMIYLLMAIGLLLASIWAGVWYISDMIEERNKR